MKKFVLVFLLTAICFQLKAQYWDKEVSNRYFWGGSFGLAFGNNTYIELSPFAGANINERLSSGLSPIFIYVGSKQADFEANILGGRLFSEFVLLNNIYEYLPVSFLGNLYVHGEYEYLSIDKAFYYNSSNLPNRVSINSVLIGGGLSMPISIKSSLKITVLANTLNNINYPYYNEPVIRMDFTTYLRKALPKRYLKGME